MKQFILVFLSIMLTAVNASTLQAQNSDDYKLVWADEFNTDGTPDSNIWNYEEGFVRNHEDQWYQKENAYQKNGLLVIEAKEELRPSPWYHEGDNRWNHSRKNIEYTSACLTTRGKYEFQYGRMEVRARIPVASGAWPAIWLLGHEYEWPSGGEIDIMEFYRIGGNPHILANAAWGNDKKWNAVWNSRKIPYTHFTEKDADWQSHFHVWRMDWDADHIRIYLDDELLNDISQSETVNGNLGGNKSPFRSPEYILLNLALGGDNGGPIDKNALPMKYEIDYVRVYQKSLPH